MPDLSHAYGFDPAYGYTLEQLLAIEAPPEPDDFADFWCRTRADTLATPLRIEQATLASPRAGFTVRLVHFDGVDGVRLGAWLVEPADGEIRRFVVVGHGYYNRPFEDIAYVERAASLNFACRGLGLSRVRGLSDQVAFHVLSGIEAKETYVHRGCVADTWSAASLMLGLFPQAAGKLEYLGESFGGGIGAVALAWDERFSFADLRVPSFGHYPLRLQCPCAGSGEPVRQKWARTPRIYEKTLQYFDAATHARRIRCPTAFACARFDPSVPPPGQFAVYNAATCDKRLCVWTSGHHEWEGSATEICRADAEAQGFRETIRNRPG